jgi:mannose-1-phosphate guanylyltransferase
MHLILLSGGSGKRLWPLSNDVRSKQFLKLLTDGSGNRQSMVERVYAQIRAANPTAHITIATNQSQVDSIRSQLGDSVDIVLEPERRDTFPAIALACAHLESEKQVGADETVIVLPCDPYTEVEFFQTLNKLDKLIKENAADIALIGVKPTMPESKFGYIVPESEIESGAYKVSRFVEKPPEEKAAELIKNGAYWNGGVFAFRLGKVLEIARANVNFANFAELHSRYSELEKISFDYKVVEKAERVAVAPYSGKWTDIGTWKALADEMSVKSLGAVTQEKTQNTFVVNELDIPLIALGTKDLIIAASPDGILVSDMEASAEVKPLVDKIEAARPMYEERRWGTYTVLAQKEHCLVKNLFIAAGKAISLQAHAHRSEVWVITKGEGKFTLDDDVKTVTVGDILKIEIGQKHKMAAVTDLYFTEVQLGDKFDESDIIRFDLSADGMEIK